MIFTNLLLMSDRSATEKSLEFSEERIYTPDQHSGWGFSVWKAMGNELIRSRELIWRLFMRDFSARYKQTVLGVLWAIILPLIAMGTFVFLNRAGLLNVGDTGIPYPVYALLGLTIWQIFSGGLTACSNALVAAGTMIVKINFPKKALVMAAMGQVLFELLIRMGLLAAILFLYRVSPQWTCIFFPLTVLPLVLLTLGLGFFFSILNVLFRDVSHMVTLGATFLMFLTPVVYPMPVGGRLGAIMSVNPLSGLVTGCRDMIVTGYFSNLSGFVCSSVLALIFFLFSWRVFHLVEIRIAERV